MASVSQRYAVPTTAGDLTRRTTLGVLIAVVALLLVRGIATGLGANLGVTGPQTPFGLVPMVSVTLVSAIGAAIAYAALSRLTERPVRNFVVLAAVVFVGMMVPVVTVAPAIGVTAVGQAVLVIFHAVVAVPLVAFITGMVRL